MGNKSYEFADFTLDCESFELSRAGHSVKLERKPMELLILLAAKNGHVVTRTEIAESLWDREVFVDTEHGINTAVRKIRQVLRDDPEQPRFVQTIPGRGYRFIATLVEVAPEAAPDVTSSSPVPLAVTTDATVRRSRLGVWLAVLGGLAVFAVVVVIALRSRLRSHAPPQIVSLAVLPLENFSGDPTQDYFADGMTDELTTMLAKNSTLHVISRTSAMQYKGIHRPLRDIARELGVDGILEGSVARSGDRVHMTIQLIHAPSDTHLWAESYDRSTQDTVSLPRQAAEAIARQLKRAVAQPAPSHPVNPEAHDAYLRGRYLWYFNNVDESGIYFKKATDLQPDYALGWAGLADYYGAGAVGGTMPAADTLSQEEAAARKAVELDDSLPEAHEALGAALLIDQWDMEGADREVGRAIELNPTFSEAYNLRSTIYTALHRSQAAVDAQKKAMELDPFTSPYALALTYLRVHRYDEAIAEADLRLAALPYDVRLLTLRYFAYFDKGESVKAEKDFEETLLAQGDKTSATEVKRLFEQGGFRAVVQWRLGRLRQKARTNYVSPIAIATLTGRLGDREQTLALLEQAYRQHRAELLWVQTDPAYDFLHADERYRAIVRKVGLPPAW